MQKCKSQYFPLWILLAIGAFFRLTDLGRQSLWLDEFTSIEVARRTIADIINGIGFDRHTPPFYYILLRCWFKILPENEFGLRLFSVFFDLINIALIFSILKKQFNFHIAWLTTLLFSVSAYSVYYAQEGRMYTLLLFFCLSIYYYALKLKEHKLDAFGILACSIITCAGLYTHYYFAIFVFCLTIGVTIQQRKQWATLFSWYIAMALGGFFFLPWIHVITSLAAGGGQSFREFTLAALPYTFFRFVAGYANMPLEYGAKTSFFATFKAHLALIVLYCGMFFPVSLLGLKQLWTSYKDSVLPFLCVLFLPAIIAIVISLKAPMYSERYVIVSFPFFLTTISLGIESFRPKTRALFFPLLFGFWVFALWQNFFNPSFGKEQWRDAAHLIESSEASSVNVIIKPDYTSGLLSFYLQPKFSVFKIKDNSNLDSFLASTVIGKDFWYVELNPKSDPTCTAPGFTAKISKLFPNENGIKACLFSTTKED